MYVMVLMITINRNLLYTFHIFLYKPHPLSLKYVSKLRHVVTNQHVVDKCKKITVGYDNASQIKADLVAFDKRNDLAILQTSSMEMASTEEKSFLQKLISSAIRQSILKYSLVIIKYSYFAIGCRTWPMSWNIQSFHFR